MQEIHLWKHRPAKVKRYSEHLLRETPEIADYIRKLDYNIQIEDLTSPSIQENSIEFPAEIPYNLES